MKKEDETMQAMCRYAIFSGMIDSSDIMDDFLDK
jgi:hypothetical protein